MSNIISKPRISERRVRTITRTEDGDIPLIWLQMGGHQKVRVDDGWEVYNGSSWEFVRDEVVTEEIVYDEGGFLDLSNREIESSDDIIKWFSNNELDSIIRLDISNNKIQSLEGFERFRNLKELNLDCNNIFGVNDADRFLYIDNIIITNNPILQSNVKLPNNFTKTAIRPCMECGAKRSNSEQGQHLTLCDKCYQKHKKKIDDEAVHELLANNKTYQAMLQGPKNRGGCVLGLVILIGVGFLLSFLVNSL